MATTFKKKEELLQEIKLIDYALVNGYQIDKEKSTVVWFKMRNEGTGDNIMINSKKNLYYNLDYNNDKGDVIQFTSNRLNGSLNVDNSKEAFYKSLVSLNKTLGIFLQDNSKKIIAEKDKYITKKEQITAIQNTSWNHVPINDYNFLNQRRAISMETLKSHYFTNRLFNTYVKMPTGHFITNTAFGKYINNELVGLEVRNNTIKNVLGDHNGVFYSNTDNMKNIDGIFYAESVIDIASCIELLNANSNFDQRKNYCFISFSGNLYESKLKTILQDLDKLPITKNTEYISITDNDFDKEENKKPGKDYDVLFTAALINKHITPLNYSSNDTFYNFEFTHKKDINLDALKDIVKEHAKVISSTIPIKEQYGKFIILKEEGNTLTLNLPKSLPLEQISFKPILQAIKAQNLYISHKPKIANDWNDELKRKKGIPIIEDEKIKKNSNKKTHGNKI